MRHVRSLSGLLFSCFRSFTRVAAAPDDVRELETISVESGVPPARHHGSCHCGNIQIELLTEISGRAGRVLALIPLPG
jgi:hypothetical protein